MTKIHKIGAIIIKDKQILVVRKRGFKNVEYIIPGGRSGASESHEQTLRRELKEEVGLELVLATPLGHFDDSALYERVPIAMDVYETEVKGEPLPASEIKEYLWVDRNYARQGIEVGSVLTRHVIPKLVEQGKL